LENIVIRGATFLRNARHMNKFLFIQGDELFYEPLEAHYKPSNEFVDLVADLFQGSFSHWTITRDGFWMHVHPGRVPKSAGEAPQPRPLPDQGWKVHVSATPSNDSSILKAAARIALANGTSFKFSLDRNVMCLMSSKAWPRSQSGKFITMYPTDLPAFTRLLEDLYAELRPYEGPYILSDKRYKDCQVLYYRYGGIARNARLEITGDETLVLISPEGAAIPDVRTPYFAPPPWETDPFPAEESSGDEIALNGKYIVEKALAFSNSGGVYLAKDCNTGAKVVIKEARPYTLMDEPGRDATGLLRKEQAILETLQDTGVTAAPLDFFQAWENVFLVEEFVEGLDAREVMLTRSPLLRSRASFDDGLRYYDIFKRLAISLIRRMSLLHERGIVFGDLSHTNLKVDPETWTVRFIDFEGAFRVGVDKPTFLYTPGYKKEASVRKDAQGVDEDLYSLAAVLTYMIFPISALGSLRGDVFDTVLKTLLTDIGWTQTEVFEVIHGFSKNEITCSRACELLERPAQIQPPGFRDDVDPDSCRGIVQELGSFLLANLRPDAKDSLFPADPFVHQTNPLSLGFGACGVLYALKNCGFEIPRPAYDWLEPRLDRLKPGSLAPGLLTGASGIAWCLWDLGFEDRAAALMKMANESSLLKAHHSYFYGMAGVGMANLYLYVRSGKNEYLSMARDLAATLCGAAKENDRGVYWEDTGIIQLGLGYGQSGVALFFLRLFELTGDEELLAKGKRALELDLSYGVEMERDGVSFPCAPSDPTLLPYLEEGSAGIAKVAMRYGLWDRTEGLFTNVHRKYAGFVGLLYGLGSFADVLTDAFLLSGDGRFLEMAKRPVSGIRDLYLIRQSSGLATPGDGLFRISCDYATGVAGVLRTLYRFSHLEAADFTLDEVAPVAGQAGERSFEDIATVRP
jgi:hypothetical protein